MTVQTPGFPAEYLSMLERDGHHNPPAFAHYLANLLSGVDLRGKRVLEIGSGRGLLAIHMGLQGAGHVLSMEPEMVGATSGVIADQRARIVALGLRNVEVLAADFNEWEAGEQRFDLIVSRASINHLYASEHHAEYHKDTWDNYVRVARRIHGMLAAGGEFIATDASRYGFFAAVRHLGIRRPWHRKKTGVNWRHHQNAGTWARIFRAAGFSQTWINYPVPYALRAVAPLANTALANYFLYGSFILRARR